MMVMKIQEKKVMDGGVGIRRALGWDGSLVLILRVCIEE